MADTSSTASEPSLHPIQLLITHPIPHQPAIHIHLTPSPRSVLLFLASGSAAEATATLGPLGSFVYALPSRTNPKEVLSTPLYAVEATLEFTTRVAKVLATKLKVPVYVGSSIGGTLGGEVGEEVQVLKRVVEVVVGQAGVGRADG
ncbi:MAG: hypothetical protein M1833_002013 [Piccolia ochrophora]|nr:MAG: hypothetical protein M1833_002013 [Piccolia ochrophora]